MPEVELSGKLEDHARFSVSQAIAEQPTIVLAGATWVSCSRGNFPHNAVGWENDLGTFLISRALHKPSFWDSAILLPANFTCNAGNYSAFLSHEGKLQHVEKYEILSAAPGSLAWFPTSGGQLNFENAVVGGRTKQGELIYIGRAKFQNSTLSNTFWIPGKVQGGFCTISWNGEEFQRINYDILLRLPGNGTAGKILPEGASIAQVMYLSDEGKIGDCNFPQDGVWAPLHKTGFFLTTMAEQLKMLCSFKNDVKNEVTKTDPTSNGPDHTLFFAMLTLFSLAYASEMWWKHGDKIQKISRSLNYASDSMIKAQQQIH